MGWKCSACLKYQNYIEMEKLNWFGNKPEFAHQRYWNNDNFLSQHNYGYNQEELLRSNLHKYNTSTSPISPWTCPNCFLTSNKSLSTLLHPHFISSPKTVSTFNLIFYIKIAHFVSNSFCTAFLVNFS